MGNYLTILREPVTALVGIFNPRPKSLGICNYECSKDFSLQKTPSLGRAAVACVVAGRGFAALLNPSLHPLASGRESHIAIAIFDLSNTRNF